MTKHVKCILILIKVRKKNVTEDIFKMKKEVCP